MNKQLKIGIVGAYLEITSKCNAECYYCYNNSSINGIEMPIDLYTKIINELSCEKNMQQITISGGEPLLHSNIIKILDTTKVLNCEIRLITNGYFIKKYIESHVFNNVAIQLTIESADAEKHDSIRGKSNFNEIMNVVCQYNRKNYCSKFICRVNISKSNYHEIEDIICLVINAGFDEIIFSFLVRSGRMTQYENDISFSTNYVLALQIINDIDKFKNKYEDRIKINNRCKPKTLCALTNESVDTSPRIIASGQVYLCEGFLDPAASIGNIKNDNLVSIINNKNTLTLINRIQSRKINLFSCKGCVWYNICEKGCPGQYMSFNAKGDAVISECVYYKRYYLKQYKKTKEINTKI